MMSPCTSFSLVYESGGRSKVVHYWRMQAAGAPVHDLMSDVRDVDWLPLEAALERLSRSYERAFLENVGPIAVEAALAGLARSRREAPAPEMSVASEHAAPMATNQSRRKSLTEILRGWLHRAA
jgi:8-oxo-dGTP diphosphatase